jgi:ATP-dependent Clp protease ATP-binding subunit ClpB
VGSEEGGQLTEQVRSKPYCVVLLDEIEKAHPDIFNTFLQVLDDGRLTDSKGRTVNFKNTVIIMTSNAGSEKISENFEKMNASNVKEMMAKSKEEVSQVLKQTMRPEFLNRIDEIIMFMPISLTNIRKITEMQLSSLAKKLKNNEIRFHVSSLGITALSRLSYNPQFGARPVKRTIQKFILNELSDRILKSEIQKDKIIYIDLKEGKFDFVNITPEELEKIKTEESKSLGVSEKDINKTPKLPENDEIAKPLNPAKRGFWQRIVDFFRNIFKKKEEMKK